MDSALGVMELALLGLLAGILGFGIGRRSTLSLPPSNEGLKPGRTMESPGVRGRKAEYDLEAVRPRLERHVRLILESFGPEFVRCAPVHFPALTDDDRLKYLKTAIRFAALRFGVTLGNSWRVRTFRFLRHEGASGRAQCDDELSS